MIKFGAYPSGTPYSDLPLVSPANIRIGSKRFKGTNAIASLQEKSVTKKKSFSTLKLGRHRGDSTASCQHTGT